MWKGPRLVSKCGSRHESRSPRERPRGAEGSTLLSAALGLEPLHLQNLTQNSLHVFIHLTLRRGEGGSRGSLGILSHRPTQFLYPLPPCPLLLFPPPASHCTDRETKAQRAAVVPPKPVSSPEWHRGGGSCTRPPLHCGPWQPPVSVGEGSSEKQDPLQVMPKSPLCTEPLF